MFHFYETFSGYKHFTIVVLLICIGLSSIVFWAVEIEKWLKRIKHKPLNRLIQESNDSSNENSENTKILALELHDR